MKRAICLFIILGLAAGSAAAFVFHDPGAYAQRAAQILQHMNKWQDQLGKMNDQIQRFREYQRTFDRYYRTINSIYRRISHASFSNLLTTSQGVYRDAQRLADLLPGPENYAYLQSVDYLLANPLYEENEDYRRYVDDLVTRHQGLLAELDRLQVQLESIRAVQHDRLATFDVYEQANAAISAGTGEAAVTEQMALLNAIALEQVRQNHEIASMLRLMLEQRLTLEREAVNHVNRQGELNRERPANLTQIQQLVGAGGD